MATIRIINPRRPRKPRRKQARKSNPFGVLHIMANPRRRRNRTVRHLRRHRNPARRRTTALAPVRRRRRSNPIRRRHSARLRNPSAGILTTAAGAALGAVGAKTIAGLVPISNTYLSYGLRAAIGWFGGDWVGKALKNPSLGDGITIGALAGVALDLYNQITGSSASGLAEYIQGGFATPSYPPGLTPRPGGSFNAGRPSVVRQSMGPQGGM